MASTLRACALSRAQSLVARRAEERRTSGMVCAALHRAASDLLKAASAELKSNTSKFNAVAPRLLSFLKTSQMLHVARCRRAQGLALRTTPDANGAVQLGPAISCLKDAEASP